MNKYLDGIYSTNNELKSFMEYFKRDSEPVVVILFGDHNPWMGDTMGANFDLDTEEGFYNYYNTPYIIWGNDTAKEVLENDFVGEGPLP